MLAENAGKQVATIQRLGGSLYILLPANYVKKNELDKGETMEGEWVDNRILYRPFEKPRGVGLGEDDRAVAKADI